MLLGNKQAILLEETEFNPLFPSLVFFIIYFQDLNGGVSLKLADLLFMSDRQTRKIFLQRHFSAQIYIDLYFITRGKNKGHLITINKFQFLSIPQNFPRF